MKKQKTLASMMTVIIILCCAVLITLLIRDLDRNKTHSAQTNHSQIQQTKPSSPVIKKDKVIKKKHKAKPSVKEKKLTAPYVSQKPELPNGCEVTSLTMLLQSAGIKVDKLTLAGQIKKVPFQSGGFMGNPNEGFVGNMYHGSRNNPGYAVYHGPVADLASRYLGHRVKDLTGDAWEDIEKQIASGVPVWTITSINFQPVPKGSWREWHTKQGTIQITFQEHSVLVTGYDEDYVYFNDPLAGGPGSKASKAAFVKAWKQFGRQAISYTPESH
ncbi:C39 family peptidase [Sporolactobacillus kofuensis]|uniref:C39 family peptidase n=1 Tax=Sporolactobacillus kofuensis TaxID=269672 RepID=A0ABW1WGA0_9BACL|nr:C39 family peptidase [Sporolactobacillus kofuensis]MCO7176377.1 C39 family peptidase [Sporolactobacillus kofuensis]